MLRKITKIVFAFAGAMLALGLVIVLSLSVWVMTGPKSLTKLLPYIESSLNPPKSPYDVSIDDAVIYWDGWSKPLDFRLRGVSLKSIQAQNELIKLNEISVGLDLASLLRFNVVPKTIILRNPQMRFFRDDDGEFYIGIGSATNQRIPLTYLLASADGGEDASKEDNALIGNIQLIAIEHAQLLLGAPDAPALFDAQDVNLHISRDNKAINAQLNIAMHYGEKPSQISGNLRLTNTQDMVVAKMELLDISPHMFARLVPEVPELATLNMPLSGWADVAVDNAGNVTVVDYKLQSTGGVFTQENYFAEPLTITHGMFEGQIRDNFQQFVVNQALVKFGESSLRVNGLLQKYPQGWAYDAIAVAEKMPINDLYKYWPHSIANTSYDWVTTHIRDGMVSKAEAHAKLTQEQIGEPFPESALDVTILAQNATVEYLPEHPKVKNVDATVEFNGKGMSITANKGKMLDAAVLKKALLSIDDLKSHKPRMHIELDVEAPAKDVATYLAIPPLDFAAPLGLDAATIAGSAAANMRFDFTLKTRFNDNYNPDLDFAINALVSGGVQPDFMGDMNLSAANGTLNITQDMLDYAGTMAISNAPLNIELRHYFKPEDFQSKYRTKYHAKGVMAVPQLAAFGVPELPFMAGNVGLDVYIQRNPTSSKINGEADITQVAANIPEIGLSKQNGTKGRISF
ncbi:MAG: hypothetical protein MK052_08260 [Alphaproteobacteria bacterium]|nr:hypothetical protein [Alphaproteobacteria bacterium]